MAEEGLRKTDNELIHIGSPIPFEVDPFLAQLDSLMEAAQDNRRNIREMVVKMVSTYHPELGGANAAVSKEREPAVIGI